MEFYGRPMVAATLIMVMCSILCFIKPNVAYIFILLFLLLILIGFIFKFNYRIIAIFFASVLFLCSVSVTNHKSNIMQNLDGQTLTAEFLAVSDSEYYDGFNSVEVILVNGEAIPKFSKFELMYNRGFDISGGQRFTAKVKLSSITNDKAKRSFYSENIFMNSYVESFQDYDGDSVFFSTLSKVRKIVSQRISENLPISSASFLKGLVLGDKSSMDFKTLSAIRRCGVSHMIVVSGLHLSIIIAAFNSVINAFVFNRKIKSVILIAAILMLVCICGFTVSVIRAAIMCIAINLSPIFKRTNDSLNSLGFAVFLILLQSPYAIFSLSFQYSVLATLAIVWIVPYYTEMLSLVIKSKIIRKICNILVTTIIATAFTLPVTISNFGEVSVISPISNVLLNYPVAYALIFAVFGVVLNSGFSIKLAGICADFSLQIIEKLASMKIATVRMGYTPFVLLMFVILSLPLMFSLYKKRKREESE